ncbi:unnamed protein product [Chrysodeixis includens]|uniref:Integrin beta n=1 Tax=Chrysodeixis includens TaxID=689277 RepID=A0A9N8L1N4_CHRIL|nr:unnamed protein product [Chrysodeixis includens]
MKARPGVPLAFNMSYLPAVDFPLDVYYLMDISFTMKTKVKDLKDQAKKLHEYLSNYTNNVRIGVGSFIEKAAFPFVDLNRNASSHAFQNLVSLTNNTQLFEKQVDGVTFGSNYDDPEAGLDALMQAMTCDKEIGWRPDARKIIVLCTDSTYHSAGDGKMVGALKPNDMQCHLKNNTYTMELELDYPSVSQINKVAKDRNFRIIFVATSNVAKEYTALSEQILGSSYAPLKEKFHVISIIKKAYDEATTTVQLDYNLPSFIQLNVDQDCKSIPIRNCGSSKSVPQVTIPATLTVKSCPPNNVYKHIVNVTTVGLGERVTIELDIDCECDCEKASPGLSPKCNNAGEHLCGICKCKPGSYGANCQCTGSSTDQKDLNKCKLNEDDSRLCSGRGACRCGKCEDCQTGFSGEFCQYDDNACPKPNKRLCFGKGVCRNAQCVCDAGWSGQDCSCPLRHDDCIAPYSKEICSGNGVCTCGKCTCSKMSDKNETYSGVFCDLCEDCAEKRCGQLEDYAACNYEHMNNKTFCDQDNNVTTSNIVVFFANKTEINKPQWHMAKWCKKELANGTYIVFKYQYADHNLNLVIQTEPELPPVANVWIAAGSAIGIVLLIGILTVIIWKILADLHDKREYEKFRASAEADGFDVSQNILYIEPTANFHNPTFDSGNH